MNWTRREPWPSVCLSRRFCAKRRRLALSANRSNRRGLFDFRDKRALGGWIGKLDHCLVPVMASWEDADTKSRKSQVWIAFSLEPGARVASCAAWMALREGRCEEPHGYN
jgi:hypothetical protein